MLRFISRQSQKEMAVDVSQARQGDHEEADTLLAFQASHTNGSLIVRASDTDILVSSLGCFGDKSGTVSP